MDAIRARNCWLLAFAACGAFVLAVWSGRPQPEPELATRCYMPVETSEAAIERLARDQQRLDAKIEDVIGQLSFATTTVERAAARERLDQLHAEAIDLRDRASWLQRLDSD